jgi:CRP-like cAMP-binding protein
VPRNVERNQLLEFAVAEAVPSWPSAHGELISFHTGDVLRSEHCNAEYAYFPCSGMLSNDLTMPDGEAVSMTAIGNEGATCCSVDETCSHFPSKSVARLPGQAWRIPVTAWRELTAQGRARELHDGYIALCLAETQQAAACHLLHDIESRLCRWLLQAHDRADGDIIRMTHAEIGSLTSIRRTSVTLIIGALQSAGIVENQRGLVRVTDRFALEMASCECYGIVGRLRRAFEQRFGLNGGLAADV